MSNVVRLLPHSSSDDQRKYRSEEDLENDKKRDPILRFQKACVDGKIITEKEFDKIRNEVKNQVDEEADWAEQHDHPPKSSALNFN